MVLYANPPPPLSLPSLSSLLSIEGDVYFAGENVLVDHGHQIVLEPQDSMIHICSGWIKLIKCL